MSELIVATVRDDHVEVRFPDGTTALLERPNDAIVAVVLPGMVRRSANMWAGANGRAEVRLVEPRAARDRRATAHQPDAWRSIGSVLSPQPPPRVYHFSLWPPAADVLST